jgi:hypothetical protein
MKNFNDFIATRKQMTPKEFNEMNNDNILEDVCSKECPYIYVYKDFYYIQIGLSGFGLVIGNQYYESEYLEEMEIKLYNDWFIDNLEGVDEWLPYIGIHSQKSSALYSIMFRDMGFDIEDVSYRNDSVDSLRLSIGSLELFDVLLPNSATNDNDKEKFNTFCVFPLEKSLDVDEFERCEDNIDGLIYDNVMEMQESFEWRFHQLAKDYMNRVLGLNNECDFENGDYEPNTLEDFMSDESGSGVWYKFPKSITLRKALNFENSVEFMTKVKNEGYDILRIWEHFKFLKKYMEFGCEPINMFEDSEVDDRESRVKASFEKAKVLIEKNISNGKIPLDTKYLDFVEIGEYFDSSELTSDFHNDVDGASDLVDLINDYLEFDCSITFSPKHYDNIKLKKRIVELEKLQSSIEDEDYKDLLKNRDYYKQKYNEVLDVFPNRDYYKQKYNELKDVFPTQSHPMLILALESLLYEYEGFEEHRAIANTKKDVINTTKIKSQIEKIEKIILNKTK